MFQSFPLGDKSSVNLRGNFHVENVTTFEEFLKDSGTGGDSMQIDEDGPVSAPKEDLKSDENTPTLVQTDENKEGKQTTLDIEALYPVFWSLQHSFSNPPRLFEEDNFKQFQKSLEATLAKFKEVPTVLQAGDSEHDKEEDSGLVDDYDAFANTFNPKYLTSRDLFKLEVGKHSPYCWGAMTDHF